MTSPQHAFDPNAFDSMLERLLNGTLDAAEATALNQWLATDPLARWRYLLYMEIHGALHRRFQVVSIDDVSQTIEAEGTDPDPMSNTMVLPAIVMSADDVDPTVIAAPPATAIRPMRTDAAEPRRPLLQRPSIRAAAVAAFLIGAVAIILSIAHHRGFQVAEAGSSGEAPAVLVATLDAHWDGPAPGIGSPLTPQPITLTSGVAHLHFAGGADVLVEGPARFVAAQASTLKLEFGKVTATAEDSGAAAPANASRFVVDTPSARVVDVGTEFGVRVDPSSGTEVRVFRGEVRVSNVAAGTSGSSQLSASAVLVRAGSAVEVIQGAAPTPLANPDRFIRKADFEIETRAENGTAADRVLAQAHRLSRDPRVVALYDFEPDERDVAKLDNTVSGAEGAGGRIISAPWEPGHLEGKHALRFDKPESRVEVNVPNPMPQMTLYAWIKLASFNHGAGGSAKGATGSPWNSLLMTDRRGSGDGYVHWLLSQEGQIELSVQHLDPEPNFSSPIVLFPRDLNVWHQVAVVYDKPSDRIAFYLDGAEVSAQPIGNRGALTVGKAQIGNWLPDNEPENFRHLDGSIDELIVFRAALNAAEIKKLWMVEQGNAR